MWGANIIESVRDFYMSSTAVFWLVWFLFSSWVLREFYFSHNIEKLNRLRKAAFGIDFMVLILFLLPWVSFPYVEYSGWDLVLSGHPLMIFLFVLIVFSTVSFLTKNETLLKTAAAAHLVSSILFIVVMISIMPGTVILTLYILAPIIASLLLLLGNVVVLLLWQQLQLRNSVK